MNEKKQAEKKKNQNRARRNWSEPNSVRYSWKFLTIDGHMSVSFDVFLQASVTLNLRIFNLLIFLGSSFLSTSAYSWTKDDKCHTHHCELLVAAPLSPQRHYVLSLSGHKGLRRLQHTSILHHMVWFSALLSPASDNTWNDLEHLWMFEAMLINVN